MVKTAPSRISRIWVLSVVVWLGLTAELVGEAVSRTRYSVDEADWITAGEVTLELVRTGASPEAWDQTYENRGLGSWGVKNPPVGKYIIGAVVQAAKRPGDVVQYHWYWHKTYEENVATSSLPPEHILRSVRMAMALLGSLCLLLVFALVRMLSGDVWVSLAALVVLWSSDVFRYHATVAMIDIPQLVMALSAVAAFILHLRNGSRMALWGALVLGGLACATKLSSATVVAAMGVFLMVRAIRSRRGVGDVVAAFTVPFLVFVAVNPFLYTDPIRKTLEIQAWWGQFQATTQASLFPEAVVSPLWRKVLFVLARGLFVMSDPSQDDVVPLVLVVSLLAVFVALFWGRASAGHLEVPLAALLRGRATALHVALAGFSLYAIVVAKAVGLSAAVLACLWGVSIITVWRHLSRRPRDPVAFESMLFFVIYSCVTLVMVTWWLPFDWSRYYLLVIALVPIWAAIGLQSVVLRARQWTSVSESTIAPGETGPADARTAG